MTTMNEARVGFEAWLGITPKGAAHDLAYEAFKAGAAWQRAHQAERPGYMPIPTAEQVAEALANVRCYHDMSAELIAPQLLANLLAALSAQQSAQPEFCCELSYKAAKQKAWNARDLTHCKCDHNEYCDHCWPADFRPGGKWHGKFVARQSARQPELTVWEGPMPESNGKSNFTAVLMRKGANLFDGIADGMTIARSEYPDRVRYEADCVRWLIGELDNEPCIIDYDADKHSGYVAQQSAHVSVPRELARKLVRTYENAVIDAAHWTDMDYEVVELRALLNGGEA